MPNMTLDTTTQLFTTKLNEYRRLIDQDIEQYCGVIEQDTLKEFGANARLEVDAYLAILRRGGKRIRGALTMLAYEMSGGTDTRMIIQAARALEMLHAYILVVDDFQDRSNVRRGGPSAHTLLAQYHEKHELAGSSEHFGASIALNAALGGAHSAQQVVIGLDVSPEIRLRVLHIINNTMIVTAHGQTTDIINEVVADVSESDIDHVLEWKTAYYTFLNPLSIGLVLAGKQESDIAEIKEYAINAGKAFQITDDILGTFGSEFESGKSPMDDIREGKRTLITEYALNHTSDDNKNFLIRMLGNNGLTPAEFERCKSILVNSGALEYARGSAEKHVELAVTSLTNLNLQLNECGTDFLRGLAYSLLGRST